VAAATQLFTERGVTGTTMAANNVEVTSKQ